LLIKQKIISKLLYHAIIRLASKLAVSISYRVSSIALRKSKFRNQVPERNSDG